MVTIKQQLVASKAAVSAGTNSRKYITIHETANTSKGATAQAHANLQSNGNSRQASWHYQVDDVQAIQSYADTAVCWHAGSSAGNAQSIGVEICVNSDGDFRKAVENAAALVAHLMRKFGVPIANVVQHNRWSGKNCPTNLRNGAKGITWAQFLDMVRANAGQPVQASEPAASSAWDERYGNTGPRVTQLQKDLVALGYKVAVDGSFGPALRDAVVKFQRDHKLGADGIYGPASQVAMRKALDAKKAPAKTLYRVIIDGKQKGAYGENDNAVAEARKAIAAGAKNIRIEKV